MKTLSYPQQSALETCYAWGKITTASRKRARIREVTLQVLVRKGLMQAEYRAMHPMEAYTIWTLTPEGKHVVT